MTVTAGELDAWEPTLWWVVFSEKTDTWWVRLFPGKYRHVKLIGYVPQCDAMVFYEYRLSRMVISVYVGPKAFEAAAPWLADGVVIAMRPNITDRPSPFWHRFTFWCVPAVKHLIGLRSGALRPDTLLRDCLRNGGKPLESGEAPDGNGRSAKRTGDEPEDHGAGRDDAPAGHHGRFHG